ncbi:ribosomal protein S18 acetylase RimI-like enzyme [Paenibacillus endophyticus]|uniref:Ribosomal protein S18 acetylase RimI-like enzyme n=2 Tax=Paenibacillus endophyticus TaxID=1294268 RepID=A0A7W5CBY2_9BACL|nr:ribosomal protein S18 acetylase RimI-like enzyme [Paenibacillus endophyticus]
MNQWDGLEYDPKHIEHCFFYGDIPPEGEKENYRIFTIRQEDREEIIGILSVYHGYPTFDSVYITFLYIGTELQGKGFGKETEAQLCKEIIKLGFEHIRVNIAIKNWQAIRFWTVAGFNGISGIYGDKVHSEDTFANIELMKSLNMRNIYQEFSESR